MTATLSSSDPRATGPTGPTAGTGTLLGFSLRRERVRVAVWTIAIGIVVAGAVTSLESTFPTEEARQARAALLSNPSAIMMSGPAFGTDDYTFGAMVANELSLYLFLASAIMSILLVIRHTRADEETGRLELLRALPVGRFAPPTAALLTVAIANAAVGAAIALALIGSGLETPSSVALGLGSALTGLVFGAVAAVTAQLSEHGRTATGMAMAVLAVAFLVRGLGDVLNSRGSWLSWFSPIAWAQQTRLYVDPRWWPLALSAVLIVVLLVLAAVFAWRRDLGAGLRRGAPGPTAASAALLSPVGLARRLLAGSFLTWGTGVFLFAVAFGALADSIGTALTDAPELGEFLPLDTAGLTSSFVATMLAFVILAAVIFSVSAVLRLRGEEQSGRAEGVLVTGSSRAALLGGWLVVVAVQTAALLVLAGLGIGLGVAAVTGEAGWVGQATLAASAYVPAIVLIAGVAVVLYGALPRAAGLSWMLVVWAALVLFLGPLLDLPGWARDLSPIAHTPLVPNAEADAVPLLVMGLVGAVLVAAGFAAFRRRDVVSSS